MAGIKSVYSLVISRNLMQFFLITLKYNKMKKQFLKQLLVLVFVLVASINSFSQKQINESFYETYDAYRTYTKSQTPGEFNSLKRIVRFEFTENTIKKYWGNQGIMKMKWELETTYTITKSKKDKANDGDDLYLYETNSQYAILYRKGSGSISKVVIYNGSEYIEYMSSTAR